jgi:hypothetical protein
MGSQLGDYVRLVDSPSISNHHRSGISLAGCIEEINPTASPPAGVQELRQLVSKTGLENSSQLSQLSNITMGN